MPTRGKTLNAWDRGLGVSHPPSRRAALECLAPLGRLVMFGAASERPMPPPDLMQLSIKGQSLVGFGVPPTARAAPKLPGKRSPATSETATSGSSAHPSRSRKRRRLTG